MNFYEVLEVSRTAGEDEIRVSFRRLAKQYHPDVSEDPNAGDRFRLLYIAYDTLKDPLKRKLYDQIQDGDISFISIDRNDRDVSQSQHERWQRRAARRAAYYERMRYEEFEEKETLGDRVGFHFRQVMALVLFFLFLTGGLGMVLYGFHFVFYEDFNGSKIAGYAFWAFGGAIAYTSGKALLGVFDAYWRK